MKSLEDRVYIDLTLSSDESVSDDLHDQLPSLEHLLERNKDVEEQVVTSAESSPIKETGKRKKVESSASRKLFEEDSTDRHVDREELNIWWHHLRLMPSFHI